MSHPSPTRAARQPLAAGAKSFASLPLALAAAGAQELLAWAEGEPGRAVATVRGVTTGAINALEPNVLGSFQLADRAQREAVDRTARAARHPASVLRWIERLAERAAEGVGTAARGASGAAAEELLNKSFVFLLVLAVGRILGTPSRGPFPLVELVDRAYGLGPFPALWAIEGLGHDLADHAWRGERPPSGLLTSPIPGLPQESLLMLHAGIGLAFSQRLLRDLTEDSPPPRLHRAVAEFVRLCRANSRRGYLGAALESLGLQTYAFHAGAMTAVVARAVRQVDPSILPFFWHGVGRAIYFDFPTQFLPCSAWVGFQIADRIAPDDRARLNLRAGLGWAFTLVNQRAPHVVARLLIGPHGGELAAGGGFANGVGSATLMRFATTPRAPFIQSFLRYQPAAPRTAALWHRLIRVPGELAIHRCYPILRGRRQLDEVFRYRPALC